MQWNAIEMCPATRTNPEAKKPDRYEELCDSTIPPT